MPILASGGINLDNLTTWLENGVDVCGFGGLLTKGSSEDIADVYKRQERRVMTISYSSICYPSSLPQSLCPVTEVFFEVF